MVAGGLVLWLAAGVTAAGAASQRTAVVAAPVAGAAALESADLALWKGDGDLAAAACALLPKTLQTACASAAEAQSGDPEVAAESAAQRAAYAAEYATRLWLPAADCPLLPGRLVAVCLKVAGTGTPLAGAAPTTSASAVGTPSTTAGGASAASTSASAALTATQRQYLYYWTHDANFTAKECALLPADLLAACQVAVKAQLAQTRKTPETLAERQQYVQQFETSGLAQDECADLPAEYVASCLAQPTVATTPTLSCTGTSNTTCTVAGQVGAPAGGTSTASTTKGSTAANSTAASSTTAASTSAAASASSSTAAGPPETLALGNTVVTSTGAYPGAQLTFPSDPSLGVAPESCPLTGSGPTLIFSDDPEKVPGPGILYQDTVSGSVRIDMYGVNASSQMLSFGALLTNPGPAIVTVDVQHAGAAGPSTDYIGVGKQALHTWFEPGAGQTRTLMPGDAAFVGTLIDHPVPVGEAINAVYDLTVSAPVQVSVVAEAQVQATTQGLSVLPSTFNSPAGTPMRGTFSGADLTCSSEVTVPDSGELRFSFGSPGSSSDFLSGYSAVDGGVSTVDYGNYGVLYDVNAQMTTTTSDPWSEFALLLHPRGSEFAGVAYTTGGIGAPGVVPVPYTNTYVEQADSAVLLGTYRLYPLVGTNVSLSWMSAASSSLPIDLLIYPVD